MHGIISGPKFWQPDDPQSLFKLADKVDGAAAYAFSYRDAGLSWVTDDRIGPALADTINCLAEESGRQAVVVAHSMGGLATQFALAQDGGKIAKNVAKVVTLGTPFEGSLLLSVSQAAIAGGDTIAAAGGNPGLAIGMEAVLSLCAKWGRDELARGRDNPCGLASVPRSPVGTALSFKSAKIDELPPWPGDEPLQSQAGTIGVDVALTIGLFPPTKVRNAGPVHRTRRGACITLGACACTRARTGICARTSTAGRSTAPCPRPGTYASTAAIAV